MASASSADLSADVLVIGGGPAGSTTATMLARKGAKVLLLERERFPRDHVGESLLPASIPVLEELGVLPAIHQAGFLPKWGATMVWGAQQTPWSWYFRETNQQNPHSYQVWRPQFDQLLLENSRANGVDVREGHHVAEVLFEGGKATGVTYQSDGSGLRTAHAGYVVDASGQAGLLGRKLGLRRWDPFFQNLAVYAYFSGAQPLPSPDENNIFIESFPHGWFWNIPLHMGWTSVGAVVDSRRGQEWILSKGPQAFLLDQIAQAPYSARMLRDADMVSGPFIVKDWSYDSAELVGDGYILVGDAGCFVDPLFSSGVHLALMAAVLAAAYVTTALKDPGMREAAAQVYKEMYYQEYRQFRDLARLFYSSNRSVESYFWEARRLLDANDESPRHAFIRAVAGQPPRGYERVVIESGQAPGDFLAGVRTVESQQAERKAWFESARQVTDRGYSPLYNLVPVLGEEVRVLRKPVVGEGEFVWGQVLVTADRSDGTPISAFVAKLVELIDGRAKVADILGRLRGGADEVRGHQIEASGLTALQVLYVDGAVEKLIPG